MVYGDKSNFIKKKVVHEKIHFILLYPRAIEYYFMQ